MGTNFIIFFLWLVPIVSMEIEENKEVKTVEMDIQISTLLKVNMLNTSSKDHCVALEYKIN